MADDTGMVASRRPGWATARDPTTVEAVTTTETIGTTAEVQGGRLLVS